MLTPGNGDARIQDALNINNLAADLSADSIAHLLSQADFEVLAQYPQYERWLVRCIKHLSTAGLFTPSNFDALIERAPHTEALAASFEILLYAHLLVSENFNVIIQYPAVSKGLAWCLVMLSREGLLENRANYDALLQYAASAHYLAESFRYLSAAKLLTQDNVNMLFQHGHYAQYYADGLTRLSDTDLLAQQNFNAFFKLSSSINFAHMLGSFMAITRLDQSSLIRFTTWCEHYKDAPYLITTWSGDASIKKSFNAKNAAYCKVYRNVLHMCLAFMGRPTDESTEMIQSNQDVLSLFLYYMMDDVGEYTYHAWRNMIISIQEMIRPLNEAYVADDGVNHYIESSHEGISRRSS